MNILKLAIVIGFSSLTIACANRLESVDRNPLALASAQLNFDCWIQEQEENNQEDEILACQEGFITTIEQAEYTAPPKTQSVQISPVISNIASIERSTVGDNARSIENGHIYFEYNEAELTSEAINQISKVAADLKALEVRKIILEAHTDTSGTEEFNMDLASARGENVKDFLISVGISSDMIKMDILGESDPILNTGDGVKEPENRQVLIIAN